MKFSITLQDGRQLYFEWTRREPVSWERFQALCILVGAIYGVSAFVYLLTSSVH